MNLDIKVQSEALTKALESYANASGKSPEDILKKQGANLDRNLSREFRTLAPQKGKVKTERLSLLKHGVGVHVRPRVYEEIRAKYQARTLIRSREIVFGRRGVTSVVRKGGKRLNLQALAVQRELGTRESGRMSLSASAKYPTTLNTQDVAKSKYGPALSLSRIAGNKLSVTLSWGDDVSTISGNTAVGIGKAKSQLAIARAIRATKDDVLVYVRRKYDEAARKAGLA